MSEGPTSSALDTRSVLGKTVLIIESFTIEDESLSLAELVRRSGLSKTTVHRTCNLLITWGVVERAGYDYRLGMRLFELGQRVPRQRILRDAAAPFMQELLYTTRSVVHLSILDGLDALVIERLSLNRPTSRLTQIAGRMPLHCTASGKALLAFSPPALVNELLREGLPRRTQRTITSALHLMRDLEAARERGAASELEEMQVGYLGIGAPILGPDSTVVAAVSATVSIHNTNIARLTGQVTAVAARIQQSLRASLG